MKPIFATSTLIDVILLSRLGRNDGGRETWAFNFLPRLVLGYDEVFVRVFGIYEKQPTKELNSLLSGKDAKRLSSHQFKVEKRRYPVFLQMWRRYWQYTHSKDHQSPDFVIGMGIFELLMILTGRYSGSKKIIWMRSIFLNEKADRIPVIVMPLFRKIEIFLLKRVDLVMANGEDIADYYRERGVLVRVVENGIDLVQWRKSPPTLKLPLHVAFIGRLTKVKGIEEFFQAVIKIKSGSYSESFVFHVVGDGPFTNTQTFHDYRHMVEYHGVVDSTELPDLLEHFDICVALTSADKNCGGGGRQMRFLNKWHLAE